MVLPDPVKKGIRERLAKSNKDSSEKVQKSHDKAEATLKDENEINRKVEESIKIATKQMHEQIKAA